MIGDMSTAPRIVPFGATRLAADRMTNGHPAYRVTQRFYDLDAFFHDRRHGALDLANYYCGDALLAPISGTLTQYRDSSGALGFRVTAGKLVVEGWHLSKYGAGHGAKVTKNSTVVGYVGNSGLDIGGCHVHLKASTDGGNTWRDPWPLLDQNYAKRVKFNSNNGINIRTGPGTPGNKTPAPVYASIVNGIIRRRTDNKNLGSTSSSYAAKNAVRGAVHGLGSQPDLWTPVYVGRAYRYVATPLVRYV